MVNKVKILVVDDEAAVAMLMVHLLSRAGCRVEVTWKPEQIFKLAQNRNFDLIVMDVNMPGMSGLAVCEKLRADPHLRHTPVIFVSGSFSNENRQRAAELGAEDCIAKPFQAEDFVNRVLSHVKKKNSRSDEFQTQDATAEEKFTQSLLVG